MKFAIIGGSGFYDAGQEVIETKQVATDYGKVEIDVIGVAGEEVAFLARHGKEHTIAPHKINYRANIAALKELGISNILASAAVGSMNPTMGCGELALPTQFVDFAFGRAASFYEEGEVKHTDMTSPYCPGLQKALMSCALMRDLVIHPEAIYVCTQGPRFETPAEIEMFRRIGGDLVGMTGVPEVVLAREAGICYATLAVISNWAAGMDDKTVSHEEVAVLAKSRMAIVRELFFCIIQDYKETKCPCCRPKE